MFQLIHSYTTNSKEDKILEGPFMILEVGNKLSSRVQGIPVHNAIHPIIMGIVLHSFIVFMARQALVGQDILIFEASQSSSDTPHSVGLLQTSYQLVAEAATYTNTHNKHNRRKSIPSAEFEPAISGIKRLYTYALDRTATGIGNFLSHP